MKKLTELIEKRIASAVAMRDTSTSQWAKNFWTVVAESLLRGARGNKYFNGDNN